MGQVSGAGASAVAPSDGPVLPKEHQDPPRRTQDCQATLNKIAIHRMHVNQDPLHEIFVRYIAIFNHPIIYISFSSARCASRARTHKGAESTGAQSPG